MVPRNSSSDGPTVVVVEAAAAELTAVQCSVLVLVLVREEQEH